MPVWPTGLESAESLDCRSGRYGGCHGKRLETLAERFRSRDGPHGWASLDLSSRQRNSATVLGSLQRYASAKAVKANRSGTVTDDAVLAGKDESPF